MRKVFTMLLAVTLGASAASASATIINDRATFLGLSGTITEHINISADFTITPEAGSSVIIVNDITTYTDKFAGTPYVIQSGVENFNAAVMFASAVNAFGMDVYEPTSTAKFNGCNVATCVDSTFEISFLVGAVLLDTITFSPANDVLDFIGFSSASAFDRIEVRETIGSNDNEMFGNFVTLTDPTSAVPLPATLPLIAAGLGAFGLVRRKSRA